jgi:hypothetical protein
MRKSKKNWLKKKNFFEKHSACMACSEKMVMADGCNVFSFFHFFGYQNFGGIWSGNSKISRIYTWIFFLNQNFLNFFVEKWWNSARTKNHWMGTSRTRQVSKKVSMVRIVKLGQSAKRRSPVPGQGGKGSYSGWQTDICRVRPSRKSVLSACQGLWKIVGRSALHASSVCAKS